MANLQTVGARIAVNSRLQLLNETIDDASSGNNTIVAAPSNGDLIRVMSVLLISSAAVTIRFESGAGTTALTGQMEVAANGGFVLDLNLAGHFECAADALLNLELSGATTVDGFIQYVLVPTADQSSA